MVSILVEFPADEMERITARAQELGYATPGEYMRALVEQDVADEFEHTELTNEQILEGLKESWREMKRGEVMTWEEMKQYLDSEDDA